VVIGLRHHAGCRGRGRRGHLLAGPLTRSASSVLGKVAGLAFQPRLEIAATSLARASVTPSTTPISAWWRPCLRTLVVFTCKGAKEDLAEKTDEEQETTLAPKSRMRPGISL